MGKALILAGCLALAACQTHAGSFCTVAKPIRLTGQTIASMTDVEVAAVLAHNKRGQALCGWKP